MSNDLTKPAVATQNQAAPKPKPKPSTIKDILQSESFQRELSAVIAETTTPKRMVRICLNNLMRKKELGECVQQSFFSCVLELAGYGLEPDGRHAHLIPRWNNREKHYECTFVIDYKGYVLLAFRSGAVKRIYATVVHSGDIFRLDRGEVLQHVPWAWRTDDQRPEEPGKIVGVWASVELLGSQSTLYDVMTTEEVEAVRFRSPAAMAGPWVTDWAEMAKKTVFRRLTKWVPISPTFMDASAGDDAQNFDFRSDTAPAIEASPRPRIELAQQAMSEFSAMMDAAESPEMVEADTQVSEPSTEKKGKKQ